MSKWQQWTTGVGIDVSEHHIRIAAVSRTGVVRKVMEIDIPDGLITDERVIKEAEVTELINKKLSKSLYKSGRWNTTILIPESRVFYKSLVADKSKRGDELITWALKQAQPDIPIPFSRAQTAVSQGATEAGGKRTTIYAVEQEVLDGFQALFNETAFVPKAMEANSKAIHRLLTSQKKVANKLFANDGLVVVIDVGHAWASLSVYTQEGDCLYSRSISYHARRADVPVGEVPSEVVDMIAGTLKNLMLYFSQQKKTLNAAILSGVEALDEQFDRLPDLIDSEEFEIQRVSRLLKLPGVSKSQLHQYGAAIGAAMRSVHQRHYSYQHNFLT